MARSRCTATLCAAALACAAVSGSAAPALAAAPASAAPPVARDVTPAAATLSARLPATARGLASFSWARATGAWKRVAARRSGPRRVTARLTGLKPGTLYRFRLVAAGRAGPVTWFRTLAAVTAPPAPEPQPATEPVEAPSRTPPLVESPEPPPPAPTPAATPTPTPVPPAPEPVVGYANPVFAGSFPDPSVLHDGRAYWAFGTGDRFPILRSNDLVSWRPTGTALAERPAWAVTVAEWHPWAPSVVRAGDRYVLFFVALSDALGERTNCVGVATAHRAEGPYTDRGPLTDASGDPVGCGDAAGRGNIDPAPFVDAGGKAYLYVSTDWACEAEAPCTLTPELAVIPLADDLLSAAGPRRPLFRGLADTWEQAPWAPVVENPWVVERDGVYHLLYSGGAWTGAYGMGHATATSPAGPFTRTGPVLVGTDDVVSPGGGMLVTGPRGGDWLVYHGRGGSLTAPRTLRIDPVTWPEGGAGPAVGGPTAGPVAEAP